MGIVDEETSVLHRLRYKFVFLHRDSYPVDKTIVLTHLIDLLQLCTPLWKITLPTSQKAIGTHVYDL